MLTQNYTLNCSRIDLYEPMPAHICGERRMAHMNPVAFGVPGHLAKVRNRKKQPAQSRHL